MHEVNVYIHYYTTGNFSYIWIIILCKHRCVCVCMHVCVVGRGGGCREGRWWNRLHNAIVKNSDWRWVWLFFIIQLKNYLTIYSYRFPNQIANEVDFSYTNQFIQFMMWGKNHSNLKFIHVYMLLVASTPPPPKKMWKYMMAISCTSELWKMIYVKIHTLVYHYYSSTWVLVQNYVLWCRLHNK